MSQNFIGANHVLNGTWPLADVYESGPVYTQAVNMGLYGHATFVLSEGAGGTGTTTITMQACTTAAGGSPTAISFRYRICDTQDTWGALSAAVATYATIAGANKMIAIEVDAEDLIAAQPTKPYLRMAMTELVDAVCLGSVVIILTDPAYPRAIPLTAIT